MFGLFSKNKSSSVALDYTQLKTDMHSHLLPGIDDGAPDLETSIHLIRQLHELGYQKFITTPHILWEMYPNTPDTILPKLDLVRNELQKQNIPVEINAAAEYYLDDHVADLLNKKEPLLTLKDRMVLCEFSLIYPMKGIKDILFEMQMQNYQPVIAHPERYIYLEKNKEFFDELKDAGCLFQLNLLSLSNHYGKAVQNLAHYLIKKQYYNLLGTDLHHQRHIEGLQTLSIPAQLQEQIAAGTIRNFSL